MYFVLFYRNTRMMLSVFDLNHYYYKVDFPLSIYRLIQIILAKKKKIEVY